MNKKLLHLLGFIFTFMIFYFIGLQFNKIENSKNYIICHSDNITKQGKNTYNIKFNSGYYTNMNIKLYADSSYNVIYWGDRTSFLFDYRLDYYFSVDIPYERSIGNDVSDDIKILKILNSIK